MFDTWMEEDILERTFFAEKACKDMAFEILPEKKNGRPPRRPAVHLC